MVAAGGDVEHRVEVGRLPGGGEHCRRPPLQRADLCRHVVVGGVLEAGVKIPAGLQIEQGPHGLSGGVAEGGGLDDGDVAGLPVAGGIPPVDTNAVSIHGRGLLGKICPAHYTPKSTHNQPQKGTARGPSLFV